MQPLHGLAVAVTRQNKDGKPDTGWLPEERLPIAQALAAYTSGTAYQGFEDDTGERSSWASVPTSARRRPTSARSPVMRSPTLR
jgi:hypothetical protein